MDAINLYEAKTQLSKLVDEAAGGKDVVISRHGKPVARLTSLKAKSSPVVFGVLKGKVRIGKDFDAPLSDDVIATFEGR
ncbi:MAG: type II toxin-antitoxin system prevent-host-death family antitoxin [Burkholderiales bacterium]|jgi:prevent-host-death family protein|nr:type II toxin-antitoxin system prevent-host-death family antitoxin [Burkholderiales bacterium]